MAPPPPASISMADAVRAYAIGKRAWTRRDIVEELGEKASGSLAGLVARGEALSRGRAVYSIPGVHESDPALLDAFRRAGTRPHATERLVSAMAPVERRARTELRRQMARTEPRRRLLQWFDERRVATVDQVRDALGPTYASMLAELVAQERLQRIVTGVYALPDVDPQGEEADLAISGLASHESAAVKAIDEAVAVSEATPFDPDLANKAVLKRWTSPTTGDGRPPIERVYVEIQGYPTIYAQKSSRRVEGKGGTVSWHGKSKEMPPFAAAALARKVFPVPPTWFWEFDEIVPRDEPRILPLPPRADTHVDIGVHDEGSPVDLDFDPRHLLPCAYVVGDTKRLDPERLQHPLPEKVRMYVDHREPASIITALRRVHNLEVVRTELDVGDYLVEGHIVFERKSASDFFASINDGAERLMMQAERMAATGLHRILLIEGGPYAQRIFNLNRLESTLSYIRDDNGIHVASMMNQRATVYTLVQATKHRIFGRSTQARQPDPIRKREVSGDPTALVRLLLSYFDGVSEERVTALVNHFGSLAAIAAADVAQLREVKGIGKTVATHIHDVFHHRISMVPRPRP